MSGKVISLLFRQAPKTNASTQPWNFLNRLPVTKYKEKFLFKVRSKGRPIKWGWDKI